MALNIKNLFKTTPQPQSVSLEEEIKNHQTFNQYGQTTCATAQGSDITLVPYLQKIFLYDKNEQAQNIILQNQYKQQAQIDINRHENNKNGYQLQKNHLSEQIDNAEKEIKDLEAEKIRIQSSDHKDNKDLKIKCLLGVIILLPLTFYLFLFYSSSFYSGFLASTEDAIGDVSLAMFNPQAFNKAFGASVTMGLLMLTFPVVFLGLGFALHFFTEQKNKWKYLKMASIVLVTFCFDCILAYKIGQMLHDMAVITGSALLDEEYTINMALHDPNTWAVIFCGFIAYIIWGIVFDMAISAYNNMTSNKIELAAIDEKISTLKADIRTYKNAVAQLDQNINAEDGAIIDLTRKLNQNVLYDYTIIRKDLTDFFAGWALMMAQLNKTPQEQQRAQQTFDQTLATLIPQT